MAAALRAHSMFDQNIQSWPSQAITSLSAARRSASNGRSHSVFSLV